jgi:hypothetical protein
VFWRYVGQYDIVKIILFLIKKDINFFSGYWPAYALDQSMVFTIPGESATSYGYWVQPSADGCTSLQYLGYWKAAYSKL